MSEKLFKVVPVKMYADQPAHLELWCDTWAIDDSSDEDILNRDCDRLNTAADAWKARETKSDSLKSMFEKYTRLYEASEHPFSSFYGNILHELRSIAAELGIELEKKKS
jgi:phage terminase small subunit